MFDHLGLYILDAAGHPVPATDVIAWGTWREQHRDRCRVAEDTVGLHWVSTVFLAIDHGSGISERPILYETAIFEEGADVVVAARYATRAEAEAGHTAIVAELTGPGRAGTRPP